MQKTRRGKCWLAGVETGLCKEAQEGRGQHAQARALGDCIGGVPFWGGSPG